jgi:hypothetical protein
MITKTKLHHDITKVIRAIDFLSDTVYTLQGLRRDMEHIRIEDPARSLSGDGPMTAKQKFVNVLTTDIYNNLYHANAAITGNTPVYSSGTFIADLSQANHGTGVWETGWQFKGEEAGTDRMIVRKNELNFWVEKERVRLTDNNGCMVKAEKECRLLNAHFYYAYGNTDKTLIAAYEHQSLRFYWNICAPAAITYIDAVTDILNIRNIPFTTKVLSDAAAYTRSDAAVLYIDRSQLDEVLPLIPLIYEQVKAGIKAAAPLFVRQLLPGVGFAEDPSNGMSFGISRSKLIAETLYTCLQEGISGHAQWEEQLEEAFEQTGISCAHPYAKAENIAQYESLIHKHIPSWK